MLRTPLASPDREDEHEQSENQSSLDDQATSAAVRQELGRDYPCDSSHNPPTV